MARTSVLAHLGGDGELVPGPARHLIVLLDGTGITASNLKLGTRHSNIYKLNLALENHNDAYEAQIAFYIPGIGSSWADKIPWEKAFGFGLISDVEQAYINICSNYYPGIAGSPGDHIYLFGFSRGAVVARLVASLISRFGLLHASRLGRFADLWDVFMGTKQASSLGTLLTAGVHRNVVIEFLGVFDTVMGNYVGSYADVLNSNFFENTLLPLKVKRALHLLALDETRPNFASVAWTGLETPVPAGAPQTFTLYLTEAVPG